ncbi:phosphate propanoyltransferase [Peptoniphilus grossensis]|uniref:phosphate propanoyltransferase n=1 Tax=Peptoniphilus grossensis TaxID=1465756 RepID=UPI000319C48F|nr:phosphate propanoyltransferase [Peptoniphilus grossensis]
MYENTSNLFERVQKMIVDNENDIFFSNNYGEDGVIPIGISNHHLHLSKEDCDLLFGKDYELTSIKDLKQPGQFACKETVNICGPKGCIEKIRVLGPFRSQTQVELLYGDCIKLGIKPEVRLSGDLNNTPGITIVGKKGAIVLKEGAIVAKRHIHMLPDEAKKFGVKNNDLVCISFQGIRGNYLDDVIIRVSEKSSLECHIDVEEANAMGIQPSTYIKIIKK